MLYFISQEDLHDKTLNPRVPQNWLVELEYEDGVTPRVCFCESIEKCLTALSYDVEGEEFYVYTIDDSCLSQAENNLVSPTIEQVPDVEATGEKWVLCSVKLKKIGKIKCLESYGDPIKFLLVERTEFITTQTAETYRWHYEWLEH